MQVVIVPDPGDAGHKMASYAARQIRDALEDVEVFVAIGAVMSVPKAEVTPERWIALGAETFTS